MSIPIKVRKIMSKMRLDVKEALVNRPDLTIQQIAADHDTSISFVNDCARELKSATGFARRPRKELV